MYFPRWAFSAEYKGGSMRIRPEKIIVTSNYHPEQCFPNREDVAPILRRFQVVEDLADLPPIPEEVPAEVMEGMDQDVPLDGQEAGVGLQEGALEEVQDGGQEAGEGLQEGGMEGVQDAGQEAGGGLQEWAREEVQDAAQEVQGALEEPPQGFWDDWGEEGTEQVGGEEVEVQEVALAGQGDARSDSQ